MRRLGPWSAALALLLVAGLTQREASGMPAQAEPVRSQSTSYFVNGGQRPGAGVVAVEELAHPGREAPRAGAERPRRCEVYSAERVPGSDRAGSYALVPGGGRTPIPAEALVPGQRYVLECSYVDDGSRAFVGPFDYQPGVSGPSAEAIARQVYEEVPLVLPQPHTAPPPDAQLVGFPVWLWVDGTVWRDFDASASIAGVSVTVVARPQAVRWDMGDGTVLTCAGPGRAWTPAIPDGERSDCSHVYRFVSDHEPGGLYRARVTVSWSVSWSATTGEAGTLPVASRTTPFTLDVGQRQAVITYGSR
jgi:hypothetical protein